MAEYIEREALLADIDAAMNNAGMGYVVGQTLKRYIKRQTAADVVEVVRCKNCIRCEEERGFIGLVLYCLHWARNTEEDGYCHEGIKRMDGE